MVSVRVCLLSSVRLLFTRLGGNTMKRITLVILAALIFLPVAHADSAPPNTPIDDVTFTAIFTGANGATETVTGSFEWSNIVFEEGMVPGTSQVSGSGFMGNFIGPGIGFGYIPFFGSFGDEIDLLFNYEDPADTPNFFFNIFGCNSVECNDAYPGNNGFEGNGPSSETFTVTPQVPEPNSLILLAAGIALVGLLRLRGSSTKAA